MKVKIQRKNKNKSVRLFLPTVLMIVGFFISLGTGIAEPNYTDTEILWAIFWAEGGYKAEYYFGIRSIPYKDFNEAKQICLNTISNNRKRYADYGYKLYPTYLEFLASRYCPIGADNDPKGLNKNWLKNVLYYLQKGGSNANHSRNIKNLR